MGSQMNCFVPSAPLARTPHACMGRKTRFQPQKVRASEKDDDDRAQSGSQLTSILKRKRRQLTEVLQEYTNEEIFDRLGIDDDAAQPSNPMQYRFTGLIPEVKLTSGRTVIVIELRKPSPSWTPGDLADLAQLCEDGGADAVVVPTDAEDTSTGLADLLAVCRRVRIPVIRRDWILHPLQIHEAKEAGASGVMGLVTSILGRHSAMYSSYAASIGLDCPVEVVNSEELESMQQLGVPFFGCNIGVGLSVPGFRSEIAQKLIESMDFGMSSIMGVTSLEEAQKARDCGADMVFVKHEWGIRHFVQKAQGAVHRTAAGDTNLDRSSVQKLETSKCEPMRDIIAEFMRELKYALSGD